MVATQLSPRSRPLSEAALTVESLLSRYPALDARELDTLIETFPRLAILDVGLLSADDRLGPRLDAFQRDHRKRLKPPLGTRMAVWAMLAALPVAAATGVLWVTLSHAF